MIKTDVPGICRADTGALINTNNFELLAYRAKKEEKKVLNSLVSKNNSFDTRLADLEKQIQELTLLMSKMNPGT